jgi:hypothetical protein
MIEAGDDKVAISAPMSCGRDPSCPSSSLSKVPRIAPDAHALASHRIFSSTESRAV